VTVGADGSPREARQGTRRNRDHKRLIEVSGALVIAVPSYSLRRPVPGRRPRRPPCAPCLRGSAL